MKSRSNAAPHCTSSDEWDAVIIAGAVTWTAYVFLGAGAKDKVECPTREVATAQAVLMAKSYGRKALVYAINADGRQAVATLVHPNGAIAA